MPSAVVDVDGVAEVAAELGRVSAKVRHGAYEVTRRYIDVAKKGIVERAPYAGTPPIVYRDTWSVEMRMEPGGPVGIASTWAPYGRRLENGFEGVDALGRHYSQAPQPHVEPVVSSIEEPYFAALLALVGRT